MCKTKLRRHGRHLEITDGVEGTSKEFRAFYRSTAHDLIIFKLFQGGRGWEGIHRPLTLAAVAYVRPSCYCHHVTELYQLKRHMAESQSYEGNSPPIVCKKVNLLRPPFLLFITSGGFRGARGRQPSRRPRGRHFVLLSSNILSLNCKIV